MDEHLRSLASAQGGVIQSAQALAGGMSADEIRGRVERGEWLALRKGHFVDAALVVGADAATRHKIDIAAALLSYETPSARPGGPAVPAGGPPRLMAGHRSAAVLWGLPAPALEPVPPPTPSTTLLQPTRLLGPGSIELVNRDRARRTTRYGVRMRPAAVPPEHVGRLGGIALTSRARTAVVVARLCGYRAGVFIADAALRQGCTRDELHAAARFCRNWPGGRLALRAALFADGRAGSVAESLARLILADAGFGTAKLQVPVYDGTGNVVAFLDIVVCRWVGIEVDGRIKYTRPWGPRGDVLWNEKLREDYVWDKSYEIVRTNWDELQHRPNDMLAKVRRAEARARRVHG